MAAKIRHFGTGREASYNSSGVFIPVGMEVPVIVGGGTQIATTGNTDLLVVVPFTGVVTAAYVTVEDALTADDTNYITFSITNKTTGAGSTAMLAATDPNTTKATGGSSLAAYTRRALTLHGTAANLVVTQFHTLLIRAAATGTLAGAVDRTGYMLLIRRTA